MEEKADLADDLASFRQRWHAELQKEKENKKNLENSEEGGSAVSTEEQAAQLFLKGSRYEREGKLNVAVHFYRQAVHLVPDIEFKLAEHQQQPLGMYSSSGDESEEEVDYEQCVNSIQLETLTTELGNMNIERMCEPEASQTMTHISVLPTELLMVLFKWVISKDVDVKSLARLSLVCKWFYMCARDEELWKQICLRIWGINCFTSIDVYKNCWKRMFSERPRVKFDGIYISSNSYIRIGEPTVDSFYKPCHVVEYCKYLRFFSDGKVLIYTSAEEPQFVLQLLQYPPYRDPSVYIGYYRLTGDDTVGVHYTRVTRPQKEHRRRRTRDKGEIREQQFFMALTVKSMKKKRNNQLLLDHYTYQIINRKSGESNSSEIDPSSFKPFYFSGVRSYVSQSVSPL